MAHLVSSDTHASIWELDVGVLSSCGTVCFSLSYPNDTLIVWGNARHRRASVLSSNRLRGNCRHNTTVALYADCTFLFQHEAGVPRDRVTATSFTVRDTRNMSVKCGLTTLWPCIPHQATNVALSSFQLMCHIIIQPSSACPPRDQICPTR